jgi:co-chaperonin GroES (HSP10)
LPDTFSHQPTHDNICLKIVKVTPGMPKIRGVYVPAPEQLRPKKYGTVIAVGPGRVHPQTGFTPPLPCKVGDVVMIREIAGDPVIVDGEEYLWCMPDECLAVVTGELAE